MRWLASALLLILVAAFAYALWPSATPPPTEVPDAPRPTTTVPAPRPPRAEPPPPAPVEPPRPVAAPSPAAPPPTPAEPGELDAEPDDAHLAALGLDRDDVEPLDGGVLHAISRDGIKGAVQEKLPEIRECYEDWLKADPKLGGKLRVQFRITEIPGRARAKVSDVDIPDGGIGHVVMEGCVRNVFKSMRFEVPRGGETLVTYPLQFESSAENTNAPPP